MRYAVRNLCVILGVLALLPECLAGPAGTSFRYQGQLKNNGIPVNAAAASLVFRLWDAQTAGNQVGSDVVVPGVLVVNGLFTVEVDFGTTAFDGQARWIEIGVDTAGGSNWAWLSPRQAVQTAPYATYALNAGGPWLTGTDLIYYSSGNVGVGTNAPTFPLEVVSTSGKFGNTAILGKITSSTGTNYGVRGMIASLLGAAVQGEATGTGGAGVRGISESGVGVAGTVNTTTGGGFGVSGLAHSATGQAVRGFNDAASGDAVGVYGETASADGYGGYFQGNGYFSGRLGIGVTNPQAPLTLAGGNWDVATGDGDVQIGNTNGRLKIGVATSGGGLGISRLNAQSASASPKLILGAAGQDVMAVWTTAVGIGTGTSLPASGTKLDVNGKVKMTGFQLGSSATSGYVLTADASGNGTWQANSGGSFSLPYTGSISSTGAAIDITNTGTSAGTRAIRARVTNASINSDAAAGAFESTGTSSWAILANADASAIYATGGTGYGIMSYGSSGGYFSASGTGGKAVWGNAGSQATNGFGGYFQSSATGGTGVFARASAANGVGATIEATGTGGVGLVAKGPVAGARIYGHLELYEHGTTNKILEMGKGLDYAEGFDVAGDSSQIGPGSVLVIDPKNPGRLAISRSAYDRKVAGIVAGAKGLGSGVRLGAGQFDHDVALAGRVYCNVTAGPDGIEPGDLLTTANVPGHAMKASDHAKSQGAILGKAMEPLAAGQRGQILVLVTLQ